MLAYWVEIESAIAAAMSICGMTRPLSSDPPRAWQDCRTASESEKKCATHTGLDNARRGPDNRATTRQRHHKFAKDNDHYKTKQHYERCHMILHNLQHGGKELKTLLIKAAAEPLALNDTGSDSDEEVGGVSRCRGVRFR